MSNTTKTQINLDQIEQELKDSIWRNFDVIKEHNQIKVLNAFKKAGVQNNHYTWVTGYGYDDLGKEKLDEIYAAYFNTEAALVRPNLVSGTHAISCAVLGALDAGDEVLTIGQPYDTLQSVFKKFSQKYQLSFNASPQIDFKQNSQVCNLDLTKYITKKTKVIFIQRSRGYEWRDSYSLNLIKDIISKAKSIKPELIAFVDNCYGEFTQKLEPTDFGADIIAGSLIKNPGGGIVNAGAYIAGKKALVEAAAEVMTAPGIGVHGACMFDQTRLMMQGFFMAPLVVSEALKGMSLAAKAFTEAGFVSIPSFDAERNDIIQATKFNDRDKLIKFCQVVQSMSPINSMFAPIPDDISGYEDQVIMAAGSFIEGSSIELSADAPLREPYIAYFQGGLSYAHTKQVVAKLVKVLNGGGGKYNDGLTEGFY